MFGMDELKPCPWCGNKADLVQTKCIANGFVGYYAFHYSLDCPLAEVRTKIMETPEEAIEAWNRRAEK